MRCKNCGWENDPSAPKCIKCNAPLNSSVAGPAPMPFQQPQPYQQPQQPGYEPPLRGTVSEKQAFGTKGPGQQAQMPNEGTIGPANDGRCPSCGYPVSPSAQSCPVCGTSMQAAAPAPAPRPAAAQQNVCKKCGNPLPQGTRFCGNCGEPVVVGPRRAGIGGGTINSGPVAVEGSFFTLLIQPWDNEHAQYQPVTYSGDSIVLNRANTDPNNSSITSREQAVITREGDKWYIEDRSDLHSTLLRVRGKMELKDGDIIVLGNRKFEFKG